MVLVYEITILGTERIFRFDISPYPAAAACHTDNASSGASYTNAADCQSDILPYHDSGIGC